MQHSFTPQESYFLNLIKRTPHVEELVKGLRHEGFPSIVEEEQKGTRFQKCRRLYDRLHRHCFSYDDTRKDQLKTIFYESSNGSAAELLYSISNPADDHILKKVLSQPCHVIPMAITAKNMLQIFNCAKIGNVYKLKSLMYALAAYCAGLGEIRHCTTYGDIDLKQYRQRLRAALLENRDWSDKTLLHAAISAPTTESLDVILQFAYEARAKEELLDAEDVYGETALHGAIKKRYVLMVKKLIIEGSNLISRNTIDQHSLQLIYLRLPSILPFMMDLAITYNGDIYNTDTFWMNIDFTALITPINTSPTQANDLIRVREKMQSNPTLKLVIMSDDSITKDDTLKGLSSSKEELETEPLNSPLTQDEIVEADVESLRMTFKEEFEECFNMEMSGLTYLVYNDTKACSKILSHPVAQTLLDLKWSLMKKFLLFINTVLRIVIYSTYIYLLMRIYFCECPHTDSKNKCAMSIQTKVILPVVLTFIAGFLLQEMVKAVEIRRIGKFVQLSLRLCVRIVFFILVGSTTIPPMFQKHLHPSQYSLATIGVLAGAAAILQVIGNSNFHFGVHSIYIHVYGKVMMRFLTVMVTFSPLIASFTIVFSIIYPTVDEFSNFWRSLLRLAIMMQGEFDYQDILNRNHSSSGLDKTNESNLWLFWTGQISFGLFGCVLTLVLIDVFLGYTVSDIKELKSEAEFMSRCNQIKQIFATEIFFSKLMSNKVASRILRAVGLREDQCNIIPLNYKTKFRFYQILSMEQIPLQRRSAFTEKIVYSS